MRRENILVTASKKICKAQLRRAYASLQPNIYGQPHPNTHPHLFNSHNELTPGITKEEYHQRRKDLMKSLPDGSVAFLRAGGIKYMSKNIFYRFRQSSDFWYLTGFEEPDSAVILEKESSPKGYRMTIFCALKSARKELWDGPTTGLSGATDVFGADHSFDIDDLPDRLPRIFSTSSYIYTDIIVPSRPKSPKKSFMSYLNPASSYYPSSHLSTSLLPSVSELNATLNQLGTGKRRELGKEVAKLRRIKSLAEQKLMKGAAARSARAHAKTMRFAHPGMTEADVEAYFQYVCALSYKAGDPLGAPGCQRPAYVPVVASGRNALTIHHTANNHAIHDGELILLDGGGEWNGYASDITRTFPVSGTFTPPQKALYQAVLNVQKKCLALICTGSMNPAPIGQPLIGGEAANLTLPGLHRVSAQLLKEELTKIGFQFNWGESVEERLYPHLLGHAVGIDLHETDALRDKELQAGQVITIEPGIYVPEDNRYPKEFHGLGIRIEDEVLIQKDHGVVLSVDAPKEIIDVEATCQGLIDIV